MSVQFLALAKRQQRNTRIQIQHHPEYVGDSFQLYFSLPVKLCANNFINFLVHSLWNEEKMRRRCHCDSCPGKWSGCIHLPVQDFQRQSLSWVLRSHSKSRSLGVCLWGCGHLSIPSAERKAELIHCNIHGCGWEETLCPLFILPPCRESISLPLSLLRGVSVGWYEWSTFVWPAGISDWQLNSSSCSSPNFHFCHFPALYLAPDFGN